MTDTTPTTALPAHYTAYARYRPAGGLILTVVEDPAEHAGDDPGTVVLLVVLATGGWKTSTLDASTMPGFVMGTHLTTYGYMRDSRALYLDGSNAGWTRCEAPAGIAGLAAPMPGHNPLWQLPVVRLNGGAFDPPRCYCGKDQNPPRSYCYQCTPERQAAAALHALQPPEHPPMGLSSLTGRP